MVMLCKTCSEWPAIRHHSLIDPTQHERMQHVARCVSSPDELKHVGQGVSPILVAVPVVLFVALL